jgi:hypothetical protein
MGCRSFTSGCYACCHIPSIPTCCYAVQDSSIHALSGHTSLYSTSYSTLTGLCLSKVWEMQRTELLLLRGMSSLVQSQYATATRPKPSYIMAEPPFPKTGIPHSYFETACQSCISHLPRGKPNWSTSANWLSRCPRHSTYR